MFNSTTMFARRMLKTARKLFRTDSGPLTLPLGRGATIPILFLGLFSSTPTVAAPQPAQGPPLPYAYLLPAGCSEVVTNLQRRGIEVQELREDLDLEVESFRIAKIIRPPDEQHQQQRPTALSVAISNHLARVKAGALVVRTAQKSARLAASLLEPESKERLAAKAFDAAIRDGGLFPVQRLPRPVALLTVAARPLPEERKLHRPITFETIHGKEAVNFSGSPTRIDAWLKDGRHFLQMREGCLHKVDAVTGGAQPFFSSNQLAKTLARLPTISEKTARSISRRTGFEMDPDRAGALIDYENDLYYVRFDGSTAVRLTHTPEEEELASFSPDGKFVAFVREQNLYIVDLATQTERALTTDGGGEVRNGKADWVYFEEVYDRNWKAYWWSPDSARIAFHQFDDAALPLFHALDALPLHGKLESTRHPKAGDPNPAVKLGVVSVGGGAVKWVDLDGYLPGSFIISRVGWMPQSDRLYYYTQDRAQTWLDFNVWEVAGGKPERYFRDKTAAWIESPGDPQFLKDGDFLLPSDRTGWNHLYRFQTKTRTWKTITSGEWEVRKVLLVDEKQGWIYFTGTRDSAIAENLYRCRLDGSGLERLTRSEGNHRIGIDPTGNYFVDAFSDYRTPEQVRLCRADGAPMRTLDSNPVFAWEEYQLGEATLFQIPSRDGFRFETTLVKPPDFATNKTYPVWFMTYAGPDMPTIRNAWSGARAEDQMLARMGLLVFRMDPRSASGKGSASAWTAYRHLGVQELKDITEAIEWLKKQPYVDGTRIGMSGHSYGGFMTAYALTHSKLFAAGIAGAPVTDWRYYDSVYTERYMDTPQNNADGYDGSSVVKAAKNLHGRLLLLHGMVDDNVHLQNTAALMDALQKAQQEFEVMFYPQMKHGLYGTHYHRQIVNFIRRSLKLETSPGSM